MGYEKIAIPAKGLGGTTKHVGSPISATKFMKEALPPLDINEY